MSLCATASPSLLCASLCALLLQAAAHGHGTSHELIEAATREIAAHPDDAAPYLRRAQLHLEHGDWQACLLDVEETERRQKADLGAEFLRGQALVAGGFYAEAKGVLDQFVASHPEDPSALMERSRVRAALGEKEGAVGDFEHAMALLPTPEPDQVFTFVSLLCTAHREEDALRAIDSVLAAKPGLLTLIERAVQIEVGLGRHDAALRRLDAAILAAPAKEPLMAKRAALLAQAGRINESVQAWRELQDRLATLPAAKRDSHAMSLIAEQTRHALAALASLRR